MSDYCTIHTHHSWKDLTTGRIAFVLKATRSKVLFTYLGSGGIPGSSVSLARNLFVSQFKRAR